MCERGGRALVGWSQLCCYVTDQPCVVGHPVAQGEEVAIAVIHDAVLVPEAFAQSHIAIPVGGERHGDRPLDEDHAVAFGQIESTGEQAERLPDGPEPELAKPLVRGGSFRICLGLPLVQVEILTQIHVRKCVNGPSIQVPQACYFIDREGTRDHRGLCLITCSRCVLRWRRGRISLQLGQSKSPDTGDSDEGDEPLHARTSHGPFTKGVILSDQNDNKPTFAARMVREPTDPL